MQGEVKSQREGRRKIRRRRGMQELGGVKERQEKRCREW